MNEIRETWLYISINFLALSPILFPMFWLQIFLLNKKLNILKQELCNLELRLIAERIINDRN